MKIAVKGNKQLKIDDKDLEQYAQQGFDIYDESGKQLEMVGAGRTVPYTRFAETEQALRAAQAELEALRTAGGGNAAQAKKDLKALQTAHAELEQAHQAALAELEQLRAQAAKQ